MQDPTLNNSNNGGSGNGGNPPKKETKKAVEIAAELKTAKDDLYNLVRQLPKAKSENIIKKLDDANKALADFSEGNLIKQMEEQHKQLKDDILAEANFQKENHKQVAVDALQNYFNKRLELARARQQEINQKDEQMTNAANYICQYFDTPNEIKKLAMIENQKLNELNEKIRLLDEQIRIEQDDAEKTKQEDEKKAIETQKKETEKKLQEMMSSVISELGNKHNHIHRSEGLFFKTKHIVKLENGMYTSESPVDLAMTVKAHGHNDFEFSTGSTENGGWVLRQSIKEMLKIGIKDISLTKELREKMYTPRRATTFGDAFLEGRRTLNYFQMEELRQLERICSASRSAYNDIKSNNIFDDKGELKANAEGTPAIVHQTNTFMRLTTDADRLAYLEILFPVNKDIEFNKFVAELESRQPKITLDGLSPKEYFEQKMMWRWSRSSFNANYRKEKLADFNKDTLTSADRQKTYLETKDAELLAMYAQSNKLTNQDRVELVNTIFDNAQEGKPNQIGLSTHPILRTRSVSGDDMKNFIDRTLPLFKNILVKAGNVIDYNATTQQCITLMTGLREKAKSKFISEIQTGNPKAFENYFKNKLLLDELEKDVHEYLHDNLTDKQVKEELAGNMTQYDDKLKAKQNELDQKLAQHFSGLKNRPSEAASYFNAYLHPNMQLSEWSKLSPAEGDDAAALAQKVELRAHILNSFIQTHATANSNIGAEYVQKFLTPLMQQLKPEESKPLADKLKELVLTQNMKGCNKQQNETLNLVRGMFNDSSAVEVLSPANLFKAHYSSLNTLADKERVLLERIKCLLSEKPANMFQGWMFDRSFNAEMKGLLFNGNTPNEDTADIIAALKTDDPNSQSKELKNYIKRLEEMLPKAKVNTNTNANSSNRSWMPNIFSSSNTQHSDTESDATELTDLSGRSRADYSDEEKPLESHVNSAPKSPWVGVD